MTIDDACEMALNYHAGQMYGKYSYDYHLSCVAKKVRELYGRYNHELVIVAWLHDILEDTVCSRQAIAYRFGAKVADAVVSVTKVKGESYKDYIKRVRQNNLGLKVKIADTLCNLEESIKIGDVKRIKKYSKQLELLCCD